MTHAATSSHDGSQGRSAGGGSDPLRVIVVGRAGGMAQSLRRVPDLELVRVGTALEAVGELSDPIDASSPADSVVLIGSDAEPEGRDGDLDRFLAALRLVDPAVRVLRVDDGLNTGSVPGGIAEAPGYDGAIAPDADASVLRAVRKAATEESGHAAMPAGHSSARAEVRAEVDADSGADPGIAPASAPVSAPASGPGLGKGPDLGDLIDRALGAGPVRVEPPRAPADRLPGDGELAMTMLRGGDVVEEALALLRRRTGLTDLELCAPGEPGEPVVFDRRSYGVLSTNAVADGRLEPDTLRAHAAWLAGWIRLVEQHRELTEAAFTDPLTGAWNRRYFERFLGQAVEQTRVRRGSLTLMVFDIDNFKSYNDRFGHPSGDEILCETVRLLRAVIRPTDRVCRIGGDEFAVIFFEPDGPRDPSSRHPQSVHDLARRFQSQIARANYPKLGTDAPGTLTISGGLATFPWDGHDAATLITRADELALRSKSQGKNALTFGPGAAGRDEPTTE